MYLTAPKILDDNMKQYKKAFQSKANCWCLLSLPIVLGGGGVIPSRSFLEEVGGLVLPWGAGPYPMISL